VHIRRESENEAIASIETPTITEMRKREAEGEVEGESEEKVVKKRRLAPTKIDE
jgi:hypothetical protein